MAIALLTRSDALAVGDVFVNHRIDGLAGRGGMGVVYRAIDLDLDRVVALKVIAPAFAEQQDFRSRFVAESKAAASIEHPHVIPVYYAGERDGVLFIVMRYVDGPDLRALVRACGHLEPGRAAGVVAQIAGALDAAHARGLVHRDVKPANVLLDAEHHAYLTDFGLTKRVASAPHSPGWVGTPAYVAPEQIRGGPVDARADVYALGCVLVHALTGSEPYARDCDAATLRSHLDAPIPVDRVPAAFAGVVERALAKDPADRFGSAGELGRAVLAAVGSRSELGVVAVDEPPRRPRLPAHLGETEPSPPTARTRRDARGRRRAIAAGMALLALGALAAVQLRPRPAVAPASASTAPGPIAVGHRPDAVAVAGGRVWVLHSGPGLIGVLDAASGRSRGRIGIGGSATGGDLAAGFGAVWAVKASTHTLIRMDAGSTHRHLDTAIALDVTGSPDRIAIGEDAIWVLARGAYGDMDEIVKVSPREPYRQEQVIRAPSGTRDIGVGQGAVWVTNARRRTVTRIDVDDTGDRTTFDAGVAPDAIAVTRRAVWVTAPAARRVVRITTSSGRREGLRVEGRPAGIAVAGSSVWVTVPAARRLVRIDSAGFRVFERWPTAGAAEAVAPTARGVAWLTLPGRDAVQRVATGS